MMIGKNTIYLSICTTAFNVLVRVKMCKTVFFIAFLSIIYASTCANEMNNRGPKNISNTETDHLPAVMAQNVSFYLYTRQNPKNPQRLFDGNNAVLEQSNYSNSKKTKIIIHGWRQNYKSEPNPMTREAFLRHHDVNIISVDWSQDSHKIYDESAKTVPGVGKKISSFVDWLINCGTSPESFHIIGFSLGGQVTGSTARQVRGGKIAYLTGLDPANRFFENATECINSDDASYVEIIHTDRNGLGISRPRGHNDFYPNGGSSMPGCDLGDHCSHGISIEYFAESLNRESSFLAQQCADFEEIEAKMCSNLTQLNMGGSVPKKALGVFYLKTNDRPPYSLN